MSLKKSERNYFRKNILTKAGISAIIICGIAFSITTIKLSNSYSSIVDTISSIKSEGLSNAIKGFESDYNNNFEPLQKVAVEIASQTVKAQGKKVYKTPTMLLAFDSINHLHRIMPATKIDTKLANLKKALLYFKSKKIKTTFVMVPSSVVAGKTVLPKTVKDYQNPVADKTLKSLVNSKINTIDLRKEFKSNKYDLQKAFYGTDHHWTIDSAFKSSKIITGYLKSKYKMNIDSNNFYSDIKNYKQVTYKKVFYGTFENTAGRAFVGPADDITFIVPKFDTKFKFTSYTSTGEIRVMDSKKTTTKIGPFNKSLFDGRKTHSSYLNNARVEVVIKNYKSKNNLKCLVLGTSHARISTAFLAPYFKEIRYADTQKGRFSKNIYKYVSSYKPDIILFIYPAFAFTNEKTFMYNTN